MQASVNARAQEAPPPTVKRQYGVLRAVFAYGTAAEFMTRSPCHHVNIGLSLENAKAAAEERNLVVRSSTHGVDRR